MQSLIFKKIAFLIILSILITVLLAYIFWKSLKNLKLQQKKIAQLHTTIDSIAHELNTPLTTIKFALQTSPNNESKTIIERQAQRIAKVVSSIHHQSESSNLLDKNSLETYLNHLKKHYNNLSININTTYDHNKVLAQNHFEEIMNNLIENASKYKASKVDIAVKFDKQIAISIADNGIGIPLEEQKHIFEKYYRVSRAENMQINGLGIGLYLVNQIVKNYRGKIGVETNSNKGVTFNLNLPNEN